MDKKQIITTLLNPVHVTVIFICAILEFIFRGLTNIFAAIGDWTYYDAPIINPFKGPRVKK